MIILGLAPVTTGLAFDRASVRSIDKDGRLHIATTHISKATVNGYQGAEIPDFEALKLDPERVYYLLRDPRELAAAAATFNNLPILSEHIPVNAEEPMQEIVIGSTGTDATFNAPYLDNSAVIWVQDEIDEIEAETKRQWSCAYYYRADMTPGVFMGLRYDGVMRDIVGNHVALVDEGRAGPDVMVADSLPGAIKMLKSRRALMLSGAVAALVAPKLAQGKTIALDKALSGYSAKFKGDREKLAEKIVAAIKPALAQDGEIDVGDVVQLIGAIEGGTDLPEAEDDLSPAASVPPAPPGGEQPTATDADGDKLAKVLSYCQGKLSEEDMAALKAMLDDDGAAEDEDPGAEGDPKKLDGAMDAKTARKLIGTTVAEMREAERLVAPHIGEIKVAMDSAAAIYKLALDHAKVDLTGVPPKAYKAMVALLPKPSTEPEPVAMDRANAETDFYTRFPDANRLIPSA